MNILLFFFYDDVDLNHLWSSGEHKTRDVKLKKNRIFLVNLKYKKNDVNLNIIIPEPYGFGLIFFRSIE